MTVALPLTAAAGRRLEAVLVGAALVPAVPLLAGGIAGYDVGTVRASVMLVELAAAGLAGRGTLASAWGRLPGWARLIAVVWAGAMAVATMTAVHRAPAVLRTAEWGAHLAFGAAAWAWASREAGRPQRLAAWAAGGALAVTLYAVGAWCAAAWGGATVEGIAEPLAHIRYVGLYALSALMLILAAWPREAAGRSAWTAAWMLGWAALCWSGGRAPLGAAAVAVAVWAAVARPGARSLAALGGSALAGASLSMALPVDPRDMGLGRFFRTAAPSPDNFTADRDLLWQHLFDAWAGRPWLGLGPDGPAFALADHTHAHNTVVQALAEWGTVGALGFLLGVAAISLSLAVASWRRRGTPGGSVVQGASAAWLAALLCGMLDGVFYGAVTLAWAVVAVAAAAAVVAPAAPRPVSRRPALAQGVALAALAAVAGVHLGASAARFGAGSPTPDALRVRLAFATASTYRQTEILWWGKDWAREDPAAALRAARWGQQHSRTPWAFLALEGDVLAAAGDSARAVELWRRSAESHTASFPAAVVQARHRATARP